MVTRRQWIGLILGSLVLISTVLALSPVKGLSNQGWRTFGLMIMMGCWWLSECVPVAVTAFLPLLFAPLLGISGIGPVSSAYAHPLIFLFLGGFMLSLAMERSELHRRIARGAMLVVGNHPRWQVAALMGITAFLSMWISNTATTVMMVPITLSILNLVRERGDATQLGPAMLLAVAYAASIGGMATLIGTPPNALLAAYLQESYRIEIGFDRWMLFGVPFSLVFLVIAWLWLTRRLAAGDDRASESMRAMFREQLAAMGPLSPAEKRVAVVFFLAATSWILRVPLAGWTGLPIDDTVIAMAATVALFLLPKGDRSGERLLSWQATGRLPWGVLVLFGGGLALAHLIQDTGLADTIGRLVGEARQMGPIAIIITVIVSIVFLTEVTSNTATAAGFLPLLGPVAQAIGLAPPMLVIPAAMAASCAFMMPVATPPNAIVYGTGEIQMGQMVRAGLFLNLAASVLLFIFVWWGVPLIFL
ncbi:MAG: DASS family sodium-coupled anion symporter [Deltaproteobacteria bacterium]|nr:DASS family sodium-coupled anion symporter [Deltaproteobacteria bacterium]